MRDSSHSFSELSEASTHLRNQMMQRLTLDLLFENNSLYTVSYLLL